MVLGSPGGLAGSREPSAVIANRLVAFTKCIVARTASIHGFHLAPSHGFPLHRTSRDLPPKQYERSANLSPIFDL